MSRSKMHADRIAKLQNLAERAGFVILRTKSGFRICTEDGERLTPSLSAGNAMKWLEDENNRL